MLPGEAFDFHPLWRNFFDNQTLVQFDHRVLAIATWVASVSVFTWSRHLSLRPRVRTLLAWSRDCRDRAGRLGHFHAAAARSRWRWRRVHQLGAFVLATMLLWSPQAEAGLRGT